MKRFGLAILASICLPPYPLLICPIQKQIDPNTKPKCPLPLAKATRGSMLVSANLSTLLPKSINCPPKSSLSRSLSPLWPPLLLDCLVNAIYKSIL